MAINIRYDDAGAVGSLAQRAGEGQAFGRRFAMGQQLVESARAWQNQQEQLRLQSMQLQNAMRISRTPTGQASRQSGPFQKSVQESKAESQLPSAFTQNLSDAEQHALAIGIKMGDRDMVRQLIQKSLAGQGQLSPEATISGIDVTGRHTMQLTPDGVQTFIDPTGEETQQTVRPEDSPFTPVDIPKPQPSDLDFSATQPQLTPNAALVHQRHQERMAAAAAQEQRELALDPIERDLKRLEKKLADDAVSLQPLRDIAEGRKPASLYATLPISQQEYVQAWARRQQLLEQGGQQPAPAQGQQPAPDAESQLLEALRALRQ